MAGPGRILIVGAGPTGLGCAHRLEELGHHDWILLEADAWAGGLAASFVDPEGFTWDIGGHVQFSHYHYFDRLMDSLLPDEWLTHQRESWIRIAGRWVPYPFQYNIRHLPHERMKACLLGLVEARLAESPGRPAHFEEWILRQFGPGIAREFMLPYNFKVWAYPPSALAYDWIGERVARVDLGKSIVNVLDGRDEISWGPNQTFRFPVRGGTGEIWRRLAARLPPERVRFGTRVAAVSTRDRQVVLEGGERIGYGHLVSTMPLDLLCGLTDLPGLLEPAGRLRYSTVHVVGLGIDGIPPPDLATKCWMYFPEDLGPFYRATLFSNYSPNNVARPGEQWSLMAEVSESSEKPVDRSRLVEDTVAGAVAFGLVPDPGKIVSRYVRTVRHGYPTPFLGRDQVLDALLPELASHGILSRGRFGAWKYEVSNQDHSLMQGVEAADFLVSGTPEVTLVDAARVNSGTKR